MVPLTLAQVRSAVMGRSGPFFESGRTNRLPDVSVEDVSTDTRTIRPGSLFVALRGGRFDAHEFLGQAKAAGAVAAVVERKPAESPADLTLIEVGDARKALGRLANYVRRQFKHTKVIAVAGSNGKTGTKHLIHAALSRHLKGSISPRSFNNDVGVPLTLFAANPRHDYVVVECGTNHPGEIEALSRIAEPDVSVITNAGPEHLEGLKDLTGVRKENAAITSGMKADGLLVVHGDDRALVAACGAFAGRKVTFGMEKSNDLWAADVRADFSGVRFRLNGSRQEVFVPMLGRHAAVNALAAIAVARRMGVPDAAMLAGLAEAEGPAMRLERTEVGGVSVINDAYNANPASMAAAVETLRDLPHAGGRKVAVLGDMLELGAAGDGYHREAGKHAARCDLDLLLCVGPDGSLIAAGAVAGGMSSDCVHCFADADAAAREIGVLVRPGDLLLLKGSRGMRLERIAEALEPATAAVGAAYE